MSGASTSASKVAAQKRTTEVVVVERLSMMTTPPPRPSHKTGHLHADGGPPARKAPVCRDGWPAGSHVRCMAHLGDQEQSRHAALGVVFLVVVVVVVVVARHRVASLKFGERLMGRKQFVQVFRGSAAH